MSFVRCTSTLSPGYPESAFDALRHDLAVPLPQGVLQEPGFSGEQESDTLIAYIDQSDPNKTPELIPCRFASIKQSTVHGTTVSLLLELREFAFAEDLAKFNTDVRMASGGTLPAWQSDGGLKGYYWLEINTAAATSIRSKKLEDWEKIVTQLVPHPELKDESCFYTVEGIFRVTSPTALLVKEGRYELSAGSEYELRVYHYYPKNPPHTTRLTFTTTTQWITFTTNPVLDVDSRYDLKRARFRTGKPANREPAIVSVLRGVGSETPNLDFDLLFLIRGVFWQTIGYGVILGLLLAGPQVVAALSNASLPANNVVLICATSGVIGLATGLFAAFGLKRSP
jgi:hypothetical protein